MSHADSNDTKVEDLSNTTAHEADSNAGTYQVEDDLDVNLLDALREAEEHAAQLNEAKTEDSKGEDTKANAKEVADLKKALEKSKKDADSMKEAVMRAKADLENARRRFEREQKESQLYAAEKTLKAMIPVVDDLDLALANIPEGEAANVAEGVKLVHRKFLQALEAQGAKTFYPVGEVFDPSSHEALMEMESDEVEAGHIVQVFQRGWTLNSRLLRPAKVIIAK